MQGNKGLAAIGIVATLAVAAGCGGSSSKSGSTAASAGGSASGSASASGGGSSSSLPKINGSIKKIGFAQTASDNPWRLAETASMKDMAQKEGWQLVYTDAGGDASKEVSDVKNMIAQRVQAIFLAPQTEKDLAPVVKQARQAGIPVILLDRNVDQSIAKAGQDYVTFIGSDFVKEGQRAADWLIKKTGGKAKIIELEGTVGSSPANDRKKGFDETIKSQPGMKILASQSGDFNRDKGRQTMEQLLQAHPDVTAVYAHNDEMALGAIQALKAAGRHPGKDVTVVSIDGERDALKAIAAGELGASVECNPRFGPKAAATLKDFAAGKSIPTKIINPDRFFDASNAKAMEPTSY